MTIAYIVYSHAHYFRSGRSTTNWYVQPEPKRLSRSSNRIVIRSALGQGVYRQVGLPGASPSSIAVSEFISSFKKSKSFSKNGSFVLYPNIAQYSCTFPTYPSRVGTGATNEPSVSIKLVSIIEGSIDQAGVWGISPLLASVVNRESESKVIVYWLPGWLPSLGHASPNHGCGSAASYSYPSKKIVVCIDCFAHAFVVCPFNFKGHTAFC